jgi:hypothetical protein
VLRLPSPSETAAATKEALWRLYPFQMGNSKAGAYKAATANGNGLQRLYIFPFGVYITPSGLTKAVNYHTKVLDFAFPELTRINHNSPRIILNYTGIILKRLKRAFLSGKTLIFPPLEDI